MTTEASGRPPLLRFALDGARARQAAAILEGEGPRIVAALRRAVPFLSRRRVPIKVVSARASALADVGQAMAQPAHLSHFIAIPGQALGALLIDGGAAAMFIDGVLGGDGSVPPTLPPAGLTGPQEALVAGLSRNIIRALSLALSTSIGLTLEPRTATPSDTNAESAPIACVLEIGDGDQVGQLALVLPREALLARVSPAVVVPGPAADPRITRVLEDVELTLVVELSRVLLPLGRIAALKVGDTLKLDVAVDSVVSVRADGKELMRGRPTNAAGRIAVRVTSTQETSLIPTRTVQTAYERPQ